MGVVKMPETKKLLVAFDPERPDDASSDFLVPLHFKGRTFLHGLKSGNEQRYGLMVYIGRSISEDDLLAKLLDSRPEIKSDDTLLESFRRYVASLQALRIGNVVRLYDTPTGGFVLELVAKTPSGLRR
jgi:hypothetical protein